MVCQIVIINIVKKKKAAKKIRNVRGCFNLIYGGLGRPYLKYLSKIQKRSDGLSYEVRIRQRGTASKEKPVFYLEK